MPEVKENRELTTMQRRRYFNQDSRCRVVVGVTFNAIAPYLFTIQVVNDFQLQSNNNRNTVTWIDYCYLIHSRETKVEVEFLQGTTRIVASSLAGHHVKTCMKVAIL